MKMQRVIQFLLAAIVFLTGAECYASDPFANNSNYIKVFESSVPVLYLDKTSVQVERYSPPVYEISCNTPLYDKYAQKVMHGRENNLIRYNFDTKQVWIYNFSEGRWYEQDIQGISKDFKRLFNEVFKIAYSMPFYGGIAREKLAIGGIQLGNDKAYVKSIYGEPDSVNIFFSKLEDDVVEEWKYGASLQLDFGSNGRVYRIAVSANNGLSTPDGLKVGMRESRVREIYGEPWFESQDGFFPYSTSHNEWLLINTENGTVKKITIGYTW